MILSLISRPDLLIFTLVSIVVALTFHEFAHAWASYKLGDDTAKKLGRLTLNPLAHLDPVGTLMMLVAYFGWGKPVPFNPNLVKSGKFGEMLLALAGPISNILLAAVFALPARIYLLTGVSAPENQLFVFLSIMVTINIFLAAFNLLPIPPLDGSKVLYYILYWFGVSEEWIVKLDQYGYLLLFAVVVADQYGVHLFFMDFVRNAIVPGLYWLVGAGPA